MITPFALTYDRPAIAAGAVVVSALRGLVLPAGTKLVLASVAPRRH